MQGLASPVVDDGNGDAWLVHKENIREKADADKKKGPGLGPRFTGTCDVERELVRLLCRAGVRPALP